MKSAILWTTRKQTTGSSASGLVLKQVHLGTQIRFELTALSVHKNVFTLAVQCPSFAHVTPRPLRSPVR